MYRIGDQLSKSSHSNDNSNSNLEECMQNIQTNLKMMYDDAHLGSYNVNAASGFHSQFISNNNNNKPIEDQYDSQRLHFTSQQSNDFMLEDKNKQIRQLNKELADLRKGQQMTQFEQYEHYQKIIDTLKKENMVLQSKTLNNEAVQQMNSDRFIEQQELIQGLEGKCEQQTKHIQTLQKQIQDLNQQLKLNSSKQQISKQEGQQLSQQVTQLTCDYEEQQHKFIKLQQENENMKILIEQLQKDLDQRLSTQQDNQLIELIEEVLQTISQFVREYDYELQKSEFQVKFSPELRDIIKNFITQRETSIFSSIDRLSSLIISLFEQLTFDFKQIHQDTQKIKNMTLQIESLEQMTIQLEQTIGQYEQYNNQKQFDDQGKQNELVNVLINKTINEQQMGYTDKIIANLEETTTTQQLEIKQLKDLMAQKDEENLLLKKSYSEEQHKFKIYDGKLKRQHYDGLFWREIIFKLVSLIGNQETSKTIDLIQEIQQKINEQSSDEIEIRSKLELKEQDLKYLMNKISMNEMIEKRREVEVLRNTLRNCQKHIDMNKEKIDMLVRELDTNMMNEKSQQFAVSYLPKGLNLSQRLKKM